MEDKTVDILRVGEMQPERDHDFTSDKSITGDSRGRKWRLARDSGYFSFKMKVESSGTNSLVCTYWGMDNRNRTFDILVDDVKVATEDLSKFRMNKFYEVGYAIPRELTLSKTNVIVKFVPKKIIVQDRSIVSAWQKETYPH